MGPHFSFGMGKDYRFSTRTRGRNATWRRPLRSQPARSGRPTAPNSSRARRGTSAPGRPGKPPRANVSTIYSRQALSTMMTRRRRSLHTAAGRAAPLPTKVGNDIARTALPIMTEARTQHLAAHLRKGCPIPEEVVESTEDVNEETKKAQPLSNEDLTDAKNTNQSTSSKSRTSKGEEEARG